MSYCVASPVPAAAPCAVEQRRGLCSQLLPKPSRQQCRLLARIARAEGRRGLHSKVRGSVPTRTASLAPDTCSGADEPSCSPSSKAIDLGPIFSHVATSLPATFAIVSCGLLLWPTAAHAAESLPFELIGGWLEDIDAAGPWGAVVFVLTVVLAELIPLFPTQPLSLAGGLLFGPLHGGALVWVATSLAALGAFSLSRTVGADFAQRMISTEMTHSSDSGDEAGGEAGGGAGGGSNPFEAGLKGVYHAIEQGGFLQQFSAILLLRLTPVVPFSAGNYLLGLTPLPYAPFMAGSFAGMFIWSFLYASVGGASRTLLLRGANTEELFADMADKASRITESAGAVAVAVAVLGAGALVLSNMRSRQKGQSDGYDGTDSTKGGGARLEATTAAAAAASRSSDDHA